MPRVAAAPYDHLDLRSARTIEVGGLICDVDLEFLDTLDRSWHHTRHPTVSGEAGGVGVHRAVHVICVVATIELEGVLIAHSSCNRSIGSSCRLQRKQRGNVAAEVWQFLQALEADRSPDRRIHGLQSHPRSFNRDALRSFAYFHGNINGADSSYSHLLCLNSSLSKSLSSNIEIVGSRVDVHEQIASGVVGCSAARGSSAVVGQADGRAYNDRVSWIRYLAGDCACGSRLSKSRHGA